MHSLRYTGHMIPPLCGTSSRLMAACLLPGKKSVLKNKCSVAGRAPGGSMFLGYAPAANLPPNVPPRRGQSPEIVFAPSSTTHQQKTSSQSPRQRFSCQKKFKTNLAMRSGGLDRYVCVCERHFVETKSQTVRPPFQRKQGKETNTISLSSTS